MRCNMSYAKIAISIENSLLQRIDYFVKERLFSNRSEIIRKAVKEKIERLDKKRLAAECAKLDVEFEQALADEGLANRPFCFI